MASRLHTGRRGLVRAIVALAGTLVVATPITASRATAEDAVSRRPATLVEVEPCYSSAEPTPTSDEAAGAGVVRVTVVIPATVWVQLRDERPVAAMTNTGCFPRAADRFVIDDAGAAAPAVAAAVLACTPSGDWRRTGEWVDLHC